MHNTMNALMRTRGEPKSRTTLISRNITVLKKRTSIRLEPEMWAALNDIARRESCTIHDICSVVAYRKHQDTSLTAAIRVFLMLYFKSAATDEGHNRAGHGNFMNMIKRARINENNLFKSTYKELPSVY